ncbi:Branched-chain amino acid transport, permease [Acididesulfobacillus acetoxydans]|uniref:AzlC protein n=1 Tax=Acididesulfobacillus acetoxydans TaxID=1561005 RepID=A0A8S0W790_9FIRM|nr:AzlC family ABC transporter permease [Acididesulfobacillus acetoxydans]CAA7600479.1 Branched-chain amino acid transport, permease [Acididesulfobacillus acetoxydans]CEJ06613.1 AzlC protein [Acididesulfobacillus acetoxydans]
MSGSPVKAALQDSLPIVTAYFPIAVTFGVLSVAGGIAWWMTILISVCVYAGGAQFMLVGLVLSNSSPLSTVITVLLVNLRHFLYGTTLGPSFRQWTERHKWIAAFGLTDEVFAVSSTRLREKEPTPVYQFAFVFACYASWVSGTVAGAGIGQAVPTSVSQALGFALPALFLALLFLGERTLAHLIAALSGALLAIAATLLHAGSTGIVIGALVGATLGLLVREYSGKLRQKVP